MTKRFVVIGIQGAGKSTQGSLLSHQLHLPYLSTGHIFREIAKEKSVHGRYVKETLNAGFLIPDAKAIDIIEKYLKKPEYKNGYILDGFPRTLHQAKVFSHDIDKVLYIDLPEKEALWRIAGRGDESRSDETIAGVQKRISLFYEVTLPVVDFYKKQNKLLTVDGMLSIEDINKDILKQLGKELIGEKVFAWNRKKKTIIAVTGLSGAGKSTATEYFEKKKIPVIKFGTIIHDYITKKKLLKNEETEQKIRMEYRTKYGMEALAKLHEKKIRSLFKKNSIVIVDGLRSYEEFTFLHTVFPNTDIVIIQIWLDFDGRMKKIHDRKNRHKIGTKERDLNEVVEANMGPTLALCDFMIINDGTKEDLYHKLEGIYQSIYFN